MRDIQNGTKLTMRISLFTLLCNAGLSVMKLIAGIVGRSSAMISEAVNSISDVFSTIIVVIGVKIASKDDDKEHPYGHERFECVASIILAVLIGTAGVAIGISGMRKIIAADYDSLPIPTLLPMIIAIVTVVVKEGMFWLTRWGAKKTNSVALLAVAWDHRIDVLSALGAFAGILGARLGVPVLDPIASVVICLFILKVAFNVFKDALDKMVDKSCDEATIGKLREIIIAQEGVLGIDSLSTRLFGSRIYVDVEICADGALTLADTHDIAEAVHKAIEDAFPAVKHCMVHVSPYLDDKKEAAEEACEKPTKKSAE